MYHFTLSSPDTLLLFLDYKPKSGDSLDTSPDNFTAFGANHSTVRREKHRKIIRFPPVLFGTLEYHGAC